MRHLISFCRTLVECRHRGALFLEPAFVCTRCGAHRFDTSEPWILPDAVLLLAAQLRPPRDPHLESLHRQILETLGDLLARASAPTMRRVLRALRRANPKSTTVDTESRLNP